MTMNEQRADRHVEIVRTAALSSRRLRLATHHAARRGDDRKRRTAAA